MSQQDRAVEVVVNHRVLKQVADELFPKELFKGFSSRSFATWQPRMLALCALLTVTGGWTTLTAGFEKSRKIVVKVFHWLSGPGKTYQGFAKQIRKWNVELKLSVMPHLQMRMQERLPGQWEVAGFVVFAGDGSRIELSRTLSLEKEFSPKKKEEEEEERKKKEKKKKAAAARKRRQKKAPAKPKKPPAKKKPRKKQSAESIEKKTNSPQMWLTLLWHVGTGLPWDWRTGPSDSSERAHVEEMLPKLPEKSLITADAGFIGYEFWNKILDEGHNFLIRVGGNVSLLKDLGFARQHAHTVCVWPCRAATNKQPPLVMRLIELHDGKQSMYLVTNLPKCRLSDRQAAQIYNARWGIELFFRTFKQTFGCRKLRARGAENVVWEMDWSLIGLWCICLLGTEQLIAVGEDPAELSASAAIKAFQETVQNYRVRPESIAETLWSMLRVALLDSYERQSSKTSRNYPRKNKRKRCGPPKIILATDKQRSAAKQLKHDQVKKRLTA